MFKSERQKAWLKYNKPQIYYAWKKLEGNQRFGQPRVRRQRKK